MTADVFGDAPELADGQVDGLSPEHVVTLVRFLSSPASEGVNGQLFIVYGPTVTLVAAPTAEKQFTADVGRMGRRRPRARRCASTLLIAIPSWDSRPPT